LRRNPSGSTSPITARPPIDRGRGGVPLHAPPQVCESTFLRDVYRPE
jgi:hypothetical protein